MVADDEIDALAFALVRKEYSAYDGESREAVFGAMMMFIFYFDGGHFACKTPSPARPPHIKC